MPGPKLISGIMFGYSITIYFILLNGCWKMCVGIPEIKFGPQNVYVVVDENFNIPSLLNLEKKTSLRFQVICIYSFISNCKNRPVKWTHGWFFMCYTRSSYVIFPWSTFTKSSLQGHALDWVTATNVNLQFAYMKNQYI